MSLIKETWFINTEVAQVLKSFCWSYTVNIIDADDLEMQGARASVDMVLVLTELFVILE